MGSDDGLYALLTSLSALGSISAAFWLGHFKQLRLTIRETHIRRNVWKTSDEA